MEDMEIRGRSLVISVRNAQEPVFVKTLYTKTKPKNGIMG